MSADASGLVGPLRKTLGETLFPKETTDTKIYGRTPIFFIKAWETDTVLEIEDLVFSLKRSPGDAPFCVEKIFKGLLDRHLEEKVREWLPFTSPSAERKEFIKAARESIGKLALEIFFETVFEKNKEGLWEYLARVPDALVWERDRTRGLHHDPNPQSLRCILRFFASANEKTKEGCRGKIKKFIQCVINEPLLARGVPRSGSALNVFPVSIMPGNGKIGWSKDARITLAEALVANGMYEECVEYNLPEAILPLKLKFVGSAFTETDDGLIAISHTGNTTDARIAMQRACEDREWRHIWSVLSVMEYKHGRAHFVSMVDPGDIHPQNQGKISPKLALIFTNGFEDGLQGF